MALALTLSACGGGSDDSSSKDKGDQTPKPVPVKVDANIAKIAGVYDASRDGDESYLYIDSQGNIKAYDFQGDSSGSGDNCYSLVTSSTQANSSLNGGKVSFDSSKSKYVVSNAGVALEFSYDDTKGLNSFLLENAISASTGLNIKASNMNVKIGGDGSKKEENLTATTIESSLCEDK